MFDLGEETPIQIHSKINFNDNSIKRITDSNISSVGDNDRDQSKNQQIKIFEGTKVSKAMQERQKRSLSHFLKIKENSDTSLKNRKKWEAQLVGKP